MNQSLFQQFAEIVKAGKCDAFTYTPAQDSPILGHEEIRFAGEKFEFWGDGAFDRPSTLNGHWRIAFNEPFICHHIREWLTGQGWKWELHPTCFVINELGNYRTTEFTEGPELDWHISAAIVAAKRKEATL